MARYPKALWLPLIPETTDEPRITPTCVVLHSAVSGADSLHGYFGQKSVTVESHFYVRNDGTVEQYQDTERQADAQYDGNAYAISIETEDNGHPDTNPWTPAQLSALAALIRWCCDTHQIPKHANTSPTSGGIGYHSQFTAWSRDGRTCPGNARKPQIPALIAAVAQEDEVTPDDIKAIAKAVGDEVWTRPVSDLDGNTVTTGAAEGYALRNSIAAVRALQALADTLPKDAAKAVLEALNGTYDAKVELTPKES